MRNWIELAQKLFEGEVVDLGKHKMNRAFQDYADAVGGIVAGEKNFFATGKFMPFAQSYLETGDEDFFPQIYLGVDIKPYRKTPELKEFIADLRRQRFEIRHTKYHPDCPMEQRTGPYCLKKIGLNDLREIWANRANSPYGAYQPSRSGFRTSHLENYDERGVGFHASVLGYDHRRGDKYSNAYREEDHIIDDDKDYQEVIDMFAAIQRGGIKSV